MDEINEEIRKKLYTNKEYPRTITLKPIDSNYTKELITKLHPNDIYFHENKNQYLNMRYSIKKDEIYNFEIDEDKRQEYIEKRYIIFPVIIILETADCINHLIVFIVDNKKRDITYIDTLGFNNYADKEKTYKKLRKTFIKKLKEKKLKKYKKVAYDIPIQLYLKDDKNPWYYENACVIITALYIYVYVKFEGNHKKIVETIKTIREKEIKEKIQKLLILMYVSIMY